MIVSRFTAAVFWPALELKHEQKLKTHTVLNFAKSKNWFELILL